MTEPGGIDLGGLLRAPVGKLLEALGDEPVTDRRSRGERWLVFETGEMSLRVRCREMRGEQRVASWSATFREPRPTLRVAAEQVGLWPELEPDAEAAGSEPMLRRPLPAGDGEAVHSVTAAVRDGGILQLTAFDEPPDWTDEFG